MKFFQYLLVLLFLASCQREKEVPEGVTEPVLENVSANPLFGSWQSEIEDGEWGKSYSVHTYFSDGRVEGTAHMLDSGEKIEWAGTYELKENKILRTIEGGTHEITYRIEGDLLFGEVIGEKVTFQRKVD